MQFISLLDGRELVIASTYGELHYKNAGSSLVTALFQRIYDHHDLWTCFL